MRAISILQPWAWLIVRPDLTDAVARAQAFAADQVKIVENRDWRTPYRGQILIHAGKKWGPEQRDDLDRCRELYPDIEFPDEYDRGGFVGAAESKQELIDANLGIPYLTLRGRRGGSAIAAAAINGLADDLGASTA